MSLGLSIKTKAPQKRRAFIKETNLKNQFSNEELNQR